MGLARSGHASAAGALAKALQDGQPLDRRFYAVAFGLRLRAAPDAKLSELLAKSLARAGNPEERAALAIACGLADAQKARPDILDCVPNNRTGLPAAAACFALGFVAVVPTETKVLREVLAQSVDPTARLEAALALGRLRDHTVVDDLRAVLTSKTTDRDRASAAMCLGHVGDDADIDAFVTLIADRSTSDPVRACAIHGLGRLLDRDEGVRLSQLVANGRWLSLATWVDPIADPRALLE